MSHKAKVLRSPGCIDHDEIVLVPGLNLLELRHEQGQVNGVAPFARNGVLFRYRIAVGHFQFELILTGPFTPVLDISGERLLVYVEIEEGDALSGFEQSYDDVHGKGRLATATLVISHDHNVRRGIRTGPRYYGRMHHVPYRLLLSAMRVTFYLPSRRER